MKVVIIIPTYNEKGNVERLIPILEEEIFPRIKNHQMQILVADDNSPDGTTQVVQTLIKKYKNIDLLLGEKQGLGAAYMRAMDYAIKKMGAQILFEMDGDLSHDPKKIPEFLKKIDEGDDLVVGARYIKGGSIPQNWGFSRKAYSVLGNLIVKLVLGRFWHHDWTTGYRALKKEVFEKIKPELVSFQGYTFQVAFLHKAIVAGFKVGEIPFHFIDRTLGKSKIAPREYIYDLLKYIFTARFREIWHSPFPKYVLTGFSGYAINALGLEGFYRLGFTPDVAGALGGELAIIWNFIINNFWSFREQKITDVRKIPVKFLQFNLVGLGSLVIIFMTEGFGTRYFGEGARQIILILTVGFLIIPYSYSSYNLLIWKRWKPRSLRKIQNLFG